MNIANNISQKVIFDELMGWWQMNGVEVFQTPLPKPNANKNIEQETPKTPTSKSINKPNDVVSEAFSIAQSCNSLDELANKIEAFDSFHLKKTANNIVFNDGNIDAPIMIIGEAPGREEEDAKKPFIGPAGKLLDEMLYSIGLKREENIYLCNLINWRPPANREPSKEEIAISLPFLTRHIELKKPKMIIMVGAVSTCAVLNSKDGISKLRKTAHEIEINIDGLMQKIPCFAIYHPAYLMRRPAEKANTWQDLLKIRNFIKSNKITIS